MTKRTLIFLCSFACAQLQAQSVFDSLYQPQIINIYFQSGKADLDDRAMSQIDSAVAVFQRLTEPSVTRITAHTDSVGSAASNEVLAQRRAAVVIEALKTKGIRTGEIIQTAFGERKPEATNSTETGRQRNRRTTIEIARIAPMATYSGKITDTKTGEGIQATLHFRSKSRMDSTHSDPSGFYSVRLPKDSVVKLDVIAKGYFFESKAFKVLNSAEAYARQKTSPDIALAPALPGEKAIVRNLFFVGDQAVLLKSSEPELPKILKFMQVNADLKIEVAGHINFPYQDSNPIFKNMPAGISKADLIMQKQPEWRHNLSEQRAKTVYNYLLKNGIPAERMTFKGYKNSEMIFPNATSEAQQEQNRRVEIRVIAAGLK